MLTFLNHITTLKTQIYTEKYQYNNLYNRIHGTCRMNVFLLVKFRCSFQSLMFIDNHGPFQ